MNSKFSLCFFLLTYISTISLAQTQSWQWIKAGGSTTDNNSYPTAAHCTIGGCDTKGNVYAVGVVNGQNMSFDTFSSAGSYSGTGAGVSYLLFSYNCSGNMRWAKQIGSEWGDLLLYDVKTDPQGNTYFATNFRYGNGGGLIPLHLGDTVINPPVSFLAQHYLCLIKYDSLGRLVWFRNYESDSTYNTQHNQPYGLRIGTSGNVWMASLLDSNYSLAPTLHTTKKGHYLVQINPTNGNIINGYYAAGDNMFNYTNDFNNYWALDENENYYESGTIAGGPNSGGDSLVLGSHTYHVDSIHNNLEMPYVFSLDKHGQLRFIAKDTINVLYTSAGPCNYDFQAHHLVVNMRYDTVSHFAGLYKSFSAAHLASSQSYGLTALDTNGHGLWASLITSSDNNVIYSSQFMPLGDYAWGRISDGHAVYNSSDSVQAGSGSCMWNCSNFYTVLNHIDLNGNILQSFVADLGTINDNVYGGGDAIRSGAKDWRGNAFFGGSLTNYIHTTVGNVANTDGASGNFFIAKIGTSSCTCPTPGVSFNLTNSGDTVRLSGSTTAQHDSIVWHYGDGTSGRGDTLRHIYSIDGTYIITAIAYNSCGLDSLVRQITVAASCVTPGISFTQLASGDTINVTATTIAHSDSIVWHFGDGTSATGNTEQHIFAHDGTYSVLAIAYNACGSDTATRQIAVSSAACPTPAVTFTSNTSRDTVRFFSTTTYNSDSVVWYFGDGSSATQDTLLHIYQHNGVYTVLAVAYNSCGRDSAIAQVTISTVGINDVAAYRAILYPNPTGDKINVKIAAPATLGLLSASGTMLWNAPQELSEAGTYVFDLSGYASGIYYCVVAYNAGGTEVVVLNKTAFH